MGSGLILLVIVGAWLAVLVPMGLRSHDAASSSRSVERFSDAMRVLSRRPAATAGEVEVEPGAAGSVVDDPAGEAEPVAVGDVPPGVDARVATGARDSAEAPPAGDGRPGPADDEPVLDEEDWAGRPTLLHRVGAAVLAVQGFAGRTSRGVTVGWAGARERLRAATSLGAATAPRLRPVAGATAARRRRVLLGLVLAAVGALAGGLVGPSGLLAAAGVCAGLAVLYARRCRQVVRRAQARRAAAARRAAPGPAPVRVVPVAPRPVRAVAAQVPPVVEDPVPASWTVPVPARTTRPAASPDRVPVRRVAAAAGAEWQPVPVPLPTYVTKATAPARPAAGPPRRATRPVDPTPLDDPGALREAPVERRRAVNGW